MKKFQFAFFILFLPFERGFAQALHEKPLSNPVAIMSPEVASLGKHGTYEVNHYSGQPNISIPVYTVKEPGVAVPISISYDASGFMPNRNSSQVGQNWNISAGGAITRSVQGVADDYHDYNPVAVSDIKMKYDKGYIYGVQNNTPHPSQSEIENLSFLTTNYDDFLLHPTVATTPPNNVKHEFSPDIFSFNFLNHSGTFVMGNDGTVKVRSDERFKIDLDNIGETFNLATKWFEYTTEEIQTRTDLSRIVITAEDGYKFYFGGSISSLEVSFSFFNETGKSVNGRSGVINAWYLTKIEAPDGNIISFDYGTYSYNEARTIKNIGSPDGVWYATVSNFMDVRLGKQSSYEVFDFPTQWSDSFTGGLTKNLVKMVYLKRIESNTQSVVFSYSQKNGDDFPLYAGLGLTYITGPTAYYTSKLDNIYVKDKIGVASPIINDPDGLSFFPGRNFVFTYQYNGTLTTGYRCYLREFIANGAKYQFDYSRTAELPHPMTNGIDRWGYYNGKDDNDFFLKYHGCPSPGNPADYEVNFNCPGQVRTADPLKADIGMLKVITYPTGGSSTFEFESHRFKKVLKRKPTAANPMIPVPEILVQEEYAGGCRIKKVLNSSGEVIEYKYIKNYEIDPLGPSSGMLIDLDVFKFRLDLPGGHFYEIGYDNNMSKSGKISESHISYAEVIEIKGSGSHGFTKYTYTNHDDVDYPSTIACPDNYFIGPASIRIDAPALNAIHQMARMAKVSSRATERGKISKVQMYSAAPHTLLKSSEYTYNTDPLRFNEKTVGYERIFIHYMPLLVPKYSAFFIQSFHIYSYHNKVSKLVEKNYSNGQVLTQTVYYKYKSNSNSLMTEMLTTGSDNVVRKTNYFYPEDKVGDPVFSASAAMVTKFVVSPVVETKTYMGTSLISTTQNIYADVTGTGAYKPTISQSQNHSSAGSMEVLQHITYYTDGTPKQVYKPGDVRRSFIWDYKRSFPVAEVINAVDGSDIAYTSFETAENWASGGYNQWIYNGSARISSASAFMGGKVFDLNHGGAPQLISRSLNPSKTYILSGWFKGSSLNVNNLNSTDGETIKGWTYKQYKISASSIINITGTGQLDELRLYPEFAEMKTYNYQTLDGLMSENSVNNSPRYYSYDATGRLNHIWNKNQQLEKKICYNYFGQPEECIPYCDPNSPPIWINTGNVRCQVNVACGYTGYQEIEQTNTNPCSTVPNQWVPGAQDLTACGSSGLIALTVVNYSGVANLKLKITQVGPSLSTPQYYTLPATGGPSICLAGGKTNRYDIEITAPGGGFEVLANFTVAGTTVTATPALFNNVFFIATVSNHYLIIDIDF